MNKQLPAWTLYLTIGIALFLLCGVGAVASTGQPEPEIRTVTEYKTKTVTKKVEDTEKVEQLERQLETCKESTLSSTQGFVDVTNAFVTMAEGASNFDVSEIERATSMIENIDAQNIGTKARLCDPGIASKVTGLPQ